MKVRIQEVMTKDVEVVDPETPLSELLSRMVEHRISCVVVCEGLTPVGVVSERDAVRVLADHLSGVAAPAVAGDCMSAPPVTVGSRWSVERAMERLEEERIRRLVVVEPGGELAGLVTQADLLAAAQRVMERKVQARTVELQQANDRLRQLSLHDGLTGLGNRRAMDDALDRIHRVAERYDRVYSVVLADVDHFKGFNDFYGHPEGDRVLRRIARTFVDAARDADSVYRYGGEEILVLLPETGEAGAATMAERGRRMVMELGIPNETSPYGVVTVSCGIATSHPEGGALPGTWRDPISRADAALYDAKREGRNRVAAGRPSGGADGAPAPGSGAGGAGA